MIKHMAFVSYSVKDVPRAAAFYRDVIGLRPGASDFGEAWVEFDVGDTTFGVGNGEGIGIVPGSQFSAAFEVDDVKAMHARLSTLGVTVTDISESPICLSCFVTDPDGNRFALHQRTV
jgi:catechol 2,3-dioxygenase-like lactoylglutathione lyase family enzyme